MIESGFGGLRLMGHPVHPPFVHFPIGLWTASVVWDIVALFDSRPIWWELSFWCNALGLAFAMVAVITGMIDYAGLPKDHPAEKVAIYHMSVILTAYLLFGSSFLIRLPSISPSGWRLSAALLLSLAGLLLVLLGGWLGGEMIYRHKIGLNKDEANRYNNSDDTDG